MQPPNQGPQMPIESKVGLALAVPVLLMILIMFFSIQGVARIEGLVLGQIDALAEGGEAMTPAAFREAFTALVIRGRTVLVTTGAVAVLVSVLVGILASRAVSAEIARMKQSPFF